MIRFQQSCADLSAVRLLFHIKLNGLLKAEPRKVFSSVASSSVILSVEGMRTHLYRKYTFTRFVFLNTVNAQFHVLAIRRP